MQLEPLTLKSVHAIKLLCKLTKARVFVLCVCVCVCVCISVCACVRACVRGVSVSVCDYKSISITFHRLLQQALFIAP